MRKFLSLLIVLLGVSLTSWSQTDPLYAQYLNNPLLINPAYSGLNNNLSGSATYRKQWAGFDGSPTTFNVNAHTSLRDNRMGVGLIILKDKAGVNSNTEVQATYAYRLDLEGKKLSFGLQGGMVNFRGNNDDLNPHDVGDPLFTGNQNITKASFGAGAILSSDKYLIGLSVPRMLNSKATIGGTEAQLYSQHFYLMGAYIIYFNEHIRFKPSVLLKGVKGSKLSTDLNFSANIDEKYMAGVFTRNLNTYGLMAQMKVGETLRFGYSFEVPSNNSVGAKFTSHEFMVGLNLAVFDFHDKIGISNF
jgi:type IX secretion system PorP/SprF family membrane protein